jgi:hypothetical protein
MRVIRQVLRFKSDLAHMFPTIYDDALAHPNLFHWFGTAEPEFDAWLTALPLHAHPGLVDFWRRTGGGELFESETLLGPLIAEESDNVLKVNEFHWSKGMPGGMLIFHIGMNLSASFVDRHRHRNRLVLFRQGSYEVEQWFDTFNCWYRDKLRLEYASRYGLLSP